MSAEPRAASGSSPTGAVRPWVARLGAYLRIFGARGCFGDSRYLDGLERMAKEKEAPRG